MVPSRDQCACALNLEPLCALFHLQAALQHLRAGVGGLKSRCAEKHSVLVLASSQIHPPPDFFSSPMTLGSVDQLRLAAQRLGQRREGAGSFRQRPFAGYGLRTRIPSPWALQARDGRPQRCTGGLYEGSLLRRSGARVVCVSIYLYICERVFGCCLQAGTSLVS